MALWIQETRAHPVAGDGYIVLTDHADGDYLDALAKLARHRKGQVITIADFRQLCESENAVHAIRDKLRQVSPRFIALAPRLENLSENTMLCIWDLLSQLDEDPQIDVFPGILVAATKEAFVRLINNSIGAKPNENPLKAFGICQATGREGLRSFQKIELLKREMASRGGSMANAVIGPASALEVTRSVSSPGGERWEVASSGRFVPGLPEPVEEAVEDSSLVLLFGHGAPGMVCGVEIAAFDDIDLTGKVVLSGCCFAGMGNRTDIAQPKQGPDGSVIQTDRRKFVLTAVDRGAILAYGHMRLSNGFPTVAPLLEGLLAGKSTGEVYQQLLNSVIEYHHVESGFAGESSCDVAKIARRINPLLHVLVGDPAVVAFQPGQLTE